MVCFYKKFHCCQNLNIICKKYNLITNKVTEIKKNKLMWYLHFITVHEQKQKSKHVGWT